MDLVAARNRGDVPVGAQRWAEAMHRPRVNWRTRLQRYVRRAATEGFGARLDYSFRRPHRRSSSFYPLLRPSLAGAYVADVACVVDTSASISRRELEQAVTEVGAILLATARALTVIPCDAKAYEPVVVARPHEFRKLTRALRGGGGTDMICGIERALQLTLRPSVIVVLTDGYTPFPACRYPVPVVWTVWTRQGEDVSQHAVWQWAPCPPWQRRDFVFVPIDEL